MKIMTGDEAVRASVAGTHFLDTTDGIILFPASGGDGRAAAPENNDRAAAPGSSDRAAAPGSNERIAAPGSNERIVRYRPRYAGHLPEFWPSDAAEACRMARSAMLYAETYRTPVLLRLPAEIRNSRIPVVPKKQTMTERRSADYIMDRKKREEAAGRSGRSAAMNSGRSGSAAGMNSGRSGSAAGMNSGKSGRSAAGAVSQSHAPRIPEEALSDSCWNPIYGHGGKGIIVRGPAYRKVVRILNGYSGVRVLKIGTAWPLPESQIRRFLQSVRTALVLDDTQEELLVPIYAVKGKYELTGSIVPFEGMEDCADDIAAAVIDLAGRDAVMDLLRMRA